MERPNVEAQVHQELARMGRYVPRLSRAQLEVLLTVLGAIRPESRGLSSRESARRAATKSPFLPPL
jgi:hypothetical protein